MKTPLKVIVGLSGGVDSSVAALLLIEQGFEVEALFMKNWEEDDTDGHCTAQQDLSDAQKVADKLGIKLHTVNFSSDYWDDVFEHFLQEHKKGRTPNPDVLCNQKIKFKAFLDYALNLGADKISTGHYARITQENEIFQLKVGLDNNKDQSYFLHLLNQHQLSKSLFPLGEINKNEVRKIATENGFVTANKKTQQVFALLVSVIFLNFCRLTYPHNKVILLMKMGNLLNIIKAWRFIRLVSAKA